MISKFKIGGIKYSVKQVQAIEEGALGTCCSIHKEIQIRTMHQNKAIPIPSQEQTLYHEVLHAILDELGYNDLSADEKLVQSVSFLLYQFEKSKN